MNTFIDIEYNNEEKVEDSSTTKFACLNEEKDSASIIKQKQEKQKGKKGKRHYKNQYNWNDTQNRRYINFLIKKGGLLNLSLGEKKKLRVNVMMSKFIQTRNSTQCHTHHQKMMQKFHSIEAIIQELTSVFKKPKQIIVEEKLKVEQEPCYFIQRGTESLELVEMEQAFPHYEPSWKDFLFPEVLQFQQQCQNDLFMF